MTYISEFDLFNDAGNDLHKKVSRAIDKSARDVVNEDPGTTNHAERLAWAGSVRANPGMVISEAQRIILRVLDNATVAAAGNAATDTDVQFVVNGLVNEMAGV